MSRPVGRNLPDRGGETLAPRVKVRTPRLVIQRVSRRGLEASADSSFSLGDVALSQV